MAISPAGYARSSESSIARINGAARESQSKEPVQLVQSFCVGHPGRYRGMRSLGMTMAHLVPSPRPPGVMRTEMLKTFSLGNWSFQSESVFRRGSCLQEVKRVGSSGAPLAERPRVMTWPTTAERSHSGKRSQTEYRYS